jgi:hypothetical protein
LEQGVVESISGLPLDAGQMDVFLCGNPDMSREAKELFQAHGFVQDQGKQPGTIHVEEYW